MHRLWGGKELRTLDDLEGQWSYAGVGRGDHHVHLTCHTKDLGYHKCSRKQLMNAEQGAGVIYVFRK